MNVANGWSCVTSIANYTSGLNIIDDCAIDLEVLNETSG